MAVAKCWADQECFRCGENGMRITFSVNPQSAGDDRIGCDLACGACGLHKGATLGAWHDHRPFAHSADDTPQPSESTDTSNAEPAGE